MKPQHRPQQQSTTSAIITAIVTGLALWLLISLCGCSAIAKSNRSISAKAEVSDVDWTGRQGSGGFEVSVTASWEPGK